MSGKGKQNSKKAVVKVRESGKTAQSSLMNHSETSAETAEPTTSLTLLKTSDLPKYTSLLKRPLDEPLPIDDVDALQLELEMLLSSAVVRYRTLQDEITNLSSVDNDKLGRNKRSKSGKSLSMLDKKVREDKFKPKEMGAKSQSPLHAKLKQKAVVGGSANQATPNVHEMTRVEGSKDAPKLLLPKNDTPNKFWASVEPYCTDIMSEDIKLLDELITTHSDISEFKKIPPLGRHYSLMWAHNDLLQEEEAANPSREKKKSRADVGHLISKADKKVNGIAGPLTQRLVSALMEENVFVANNNTENKLFRDGDPTVLRDLSIHNSANLELRIRKELVEQGILEPDAQKKNQEDDEILAEIKRCQQELTVLSNHNVAQLKRLLNLAHEETKRQALKRKISAADNGVIEHYKKLTAAKQQKEPLSKKEQDEAWECLRERENLLEQLNSKQ